MVKAVPVGPVEAESVSVVTARAGVTGMAIISKDRTTAATRIRKSLLCFICHLRYIAEHGDYHNQLHYSRKSKEFKGVK
jgi:hypothetical protein